MCAFCASSEFRNNNYHHHRPLTNLFCICEGRTALQFHLAQWNRATNERTNTTTTTQKYNGKRHWFVACIWNGFNSNIRFATKQLKRQRRAQKTNSQKKEKIKPYGAYSLTCTIAHIANKNNRHPWPFIHPLSHTNSHTYVWRWKNTVFEDLFVWRSERICRRQNFWSYFKRTIIRCYFCLSDIFIALVVFIKYTRKFVINYTNTHLSWEAKSGRNSRRGRKFFASAAKRDNIFFIASLRRTLSLTIETEILFVFPFQLALVRIEASENVILNLFMFEVLWLFYVRVRCAVCIIVIRNARWLAGADIWEFWRKNWKTMDVSRTRIN